MQDWVKDTLHDDGIYENSDFFEYIGRIRKLIADIEELFNTRSINDVSKKSLDNSFELLSDIQQIRFDHFNYLTEHRLPQKLVNETERTQSQNIDIELGNKIKELQFLLNNNATLSASRLGNLNFILQQIKKRDEKLYDLTIEKINRRYDSPDFSHSSFERPSMGVPNFQNYGRQYRTVQPQLLPYNRNAPLNNPSPRMQSNVQTTYNVSMAPPQEIPHIPRMVQTGKNRTSMRDRKRKSNLKKIVPTLTLAATMCVVGLSGYFAKENNNSHQNYPTMPVVTENFEVSEDALATTQDIIINTARTPSFSIPEVQQENTTTTLSSVETTAENLNNESANQTSKSEVKYQKGTLMYTLDKLDDETLRVIANSLESSISDLSGPYMGAYGNGCNLRGGKTDREFVESVFKILDSRAPSIQYNDKYAIALQMEQLSGDLTKHFIAKSINDTNLYPRKDYSIEDIDFYYSYTSYGSATSFDVRTIEIKNGKRQQEALIGRKEHFNSHLRKLILNHGTLNRALNVCAVGTQEGSVICDTSRETYYSLVKLLEHEYDINIPNPGKGIRLIADIENDR